MKSNIKSSSLAGYKSGVRTIRVGSEKLIIMESITDEKYGRKS